MTPKFPILIVDDEEPIRIALELFFGDSGPLALAASAEEGLAIAQRQKFAVALVDISLGNGHSGVWLLKQLKERFPGCQVIMVTADHRLESVLECYAAGAYGYIAKPWNLEELQWLVKRAGEKFELIEKYAALASRLEASQDEAPRFQEGLPSLEADAFVSAMTERLKEFDLLTPHELEEAQEELKRQAALRSR